MKFRAPLLLNGKTATGFVVPPAVVEQLGTSKRPAVRVTINGHTYRSTIAVMGGNFMLGVSAEHREAAGVAAGDTVSVEVELDTAPRSVTVPDDFATALRQRARGEAELRTALLQQTATACALDRTGEDRRDPPAAHREVRRRVAHDLTHRRGWERSNPMGGL